MSTATIPQTDPKSVYLAHKTEIDNAISEVIERGWYILGDQVRQFEDEFSAYLGAGYTIGVANGTDAIAIALKACGIGYKDIVFTVSHTAVATAAAIEQVGAIPVFVDIDSQHYTMDPNHLEYQINHYKHQTNRGVTGQPKAIIPVHIYGQPADMRSILSISRKYDLRVIEDCAQAHGSKIEQKMVGLWGDMGTFSFYPTKNLGALGDGGAIVTNDRDLANRARLIHQYGWQTKFISEIPGVNSRLDEIQAAILRIKLKYLEDENRMRRDIAQAYSNSIENKKCILPKSSSSNTHSYHQYVIRSTNRDALMEHLDNTGIATAIHYPIPIHQQPAYAQRLAQKNALPVTEKIASEILSLPMFPYLGDEEVEKVIREIHAFLEIK